MLRSNGSSFNFDEIYPVGSLYTTIDSSFDPNIAPGWQGTWVKIDSNCYVKSAFIDPEDPDSETPGSYYRWTKRYDTNSVALTNDQIPEHNHGYGTLAVSQAGDHNHTITSACAQDTAESCHLHYVFMENGPWLDDVIPGVAYKMPYYQGSGHQTNAETASYTYLKNVIGLSDAASQAFSGWHEHTINSSSDTTGQHTHALTGSTGNTGSSQGHDHYIMVTSPKPDCIAVIIWKRTA